MRLQKEMGLTYLFISHDLVYDPAYLGPVGVMYLGSIVELAIEAADLFRAETSVHTGTDSAIPVADPEADTETDGSSWRGRY